MHIFSDIVVASLVGLLVWSVLAWAAGTPTRRRRGFRGMRRSRREQAWRLVLTALGLARAGPPRFARRQLALG